MSKLTIPNPQVLLEDASHVLFADPDDTFSDDPEWVLDVQVEYAEHALLVAQSNLEEARARKAAATGEVIAPDASDAADAWTYRILKKTLEAILFDEDMDYDERVFQARGAVFGADACQEIKKRRGKNAPR